jgi:AraC-like DNA-binding protein
MAATPLSRHLLRARDLIDARYAEPLDLDALARAACVSRWHLVRSFRGAFGETPHRYLLTRRMERAAALLRDTDHAVIDICHEVGLHSVGSFTSAFKSWFGVTPTAYRRSLPPVDQRVPLPACVVMAAARPRNRAISEKTPAAGAPNVATDS